MTNVKVLRTLTAALVLAAGVAGSAEAALITVVPGSQTIPPGGTANVSIVLSGLAANETVGGFSFDLAFLGAILDATSVVIDPDSKMGAAPLDLSEPLLTGPSPISVYYLADVFISEPNLKALQGTGFALANISFLGLAEGLSNLTLSAGLQGAFLSNYDGSGVIPAQAVSGSVCVDDGRTPGDLCSAAVVPEPSSMLLFGTGVLGLLAARYRRKGARQ